MAATRDVVGPDIELMIDANAAWTGAEAIRFLRAVEPYDIGWVEKPCWPDEPWPVIDGRLRLPG
jgi:L-fuconate dehydratase